MWAPMQSQTSIVIGLPQARHVSLQGIGGDSPRPANRDRLELFRSQKLVHLRTPEPEDVGRLLNAEEQARKFRWWTQGAHLPAAITGDMKYVEKQTDYTEPHAVLKWNLFVYMSGIP